MRKYATPSLSLLIGCLAKGPLTFKQICDALNRDPEKFRKNFYKDYVKRGHVVAAGRYNGTGGRASTLYAIAQNPVPLAPKPPRVKKPKPDRLFSDESADTIIQTAMRRRTLLELAWSGSALELMATMQPSEMASGPQA